PALVPTTSSPRSRQHSSLAPNVGFVKSSQSGKWSAPSLDVSALQLDHYSLIEVCGLAGETDGEQASQGHHPLGDRRGGGVRRGDAGRTAPPDGGWRINVVVARRRPRRP